MGGSRGGGTQSTTPWSGQQPYLTDIMGEAQNMFNQGIGQNYYPGQTVAPFSPQTQAGMDLMTQRALVGSPQQDQLGNYISQAMGQPNIDTGSIVGGAYDALSGMGTAQDMLSSLYGMGGMQSFVGGGNPYAGIPDSGLGEAQGIAGSAGMGSLPTMQPLDPTAQAQLSQTAQGDFLGSNPYLDDMYQNAASRVQENFMDTVMPGINATFGGAGRTGSNIHQEMALDAADELGESLSGLASDIYAPAYETERDRQLQAAGQLGQFGLTGTNLAADFFNQAMNRQLGAGQALGQLALGGGDLASGLYDQISTDQFRGASMVPTLRDMQYGDIQQLMNVGGMTEDQTQRLMDDAFTRFNFQQQAPWDALSNYSNVVYGLPGGYGTTRNTAGSGSRLAGGAGGAMAGAGLGQALGASALGPWAIGGGLLGLF